MKNLLYIPLFFLFLLVSCELDDNFPIENRCGSQYVRVYENHDYDFLFSDEVNQLSAGAISSSMQLGEINLWFVNNAYINTPEGKQFIHNCILVQNGNKVEVKYQMDHDTIKAFIPDEDSTHYYTINQGKLHNDKIEILLSSWEKTGNGTFDFIHTGTQLAVIELINWTIEKKKSLISNSQLLLGAALYTDSNYTYIYGSRNRDLDKEAFVARIPAGSLFQNWEYYDGYQWYNDWNAARPILNNVSDYFSVFYKDGYYILTTQSALFGQEVKQYGAYTPEGDWKDGKIIYCKSNSNDSLIALNTLVHFQNNTDTLFCSYSLHDANLTKNIATRPQFITIENWK